MATVIVPLSDTVNVTTLERFLEKLCPDVAEGVSAGFENCQDGRARITFLPVGVQHLSVIEGRILKPLEAGTCPLLVLHPQMAQSHAMKRAFSSQY